MALSLTASPIKTVNNVLSNVNGAITQLPYTFKREDTPVTGVITASGGARIGVLVASTATMTAGDSIWFETPVYGGQTITIDSIVDGGSFIIDIPFISTDTG